MEMQDTTPTEPVVDHDGSYGGYAEIARLLSAQHPERERPFSRQLVERWYKKRGWNGFPEPQLVTTRTGKVRLKFNLAEVQQWHVTFRATRRIKVDRVVEVIAPMGTIPLFDVVTESSAAA